VEPRGPRAGSLASCSHVEPRRRRIRAFRRVRGTAMHARKILKSAAMRS
jgi:hypothetical protein